MAKGNHPGKIPPKTVEKMYLDWVNGTSLTNLKNKYNVSIKTIVKYRDEDGWVKRKAKIQRVVAKKQDNAIAKRQDRHIKAYRVVQDKCLKEVEMIQMMRPIDAIKGLDLGIRGERDIVGDSIDESVTLTLRIPKGMTFGDRPSQHSGDNE